MISYELAKELKEAGYTLPDHRWTGRDGDKCDHCRHPSRKHCLPTLEELIEACGDNLSRLVHHPDHKKWRAIPYSDHHIDHWGATPTEAAARLWLAINRKNP